MLTQQQIQTLTLQAKARGYDAATTQRFLQFADQQYAQVTTPISSSQPVEEKKRTDVGGILKSIVKDPIKTLIVKPGTRIAQAGVGLYGELANRSDLVDRSLQDIRVKTPFGTYDIEGQKSGLAGAKQIAGDAAKSASYLYTPGKIAGTLGKTASAGSRILQGAKAGAIGGGLYSGGESAIQGNSLKQIGIDTLKGGFTGAAIGAAVPTAIEGVKTIRKVELSPLRVIASNSSTTKAQSALEKRYEELFTGTKSSSKLFAKSQVRGKTPAKFLADHGLIVDIDRGTVNVASTVEKIKRNAEPLEDVLTDILAAKDAGLSSANRISLDELGRRAKIALNTEQNKAGGYLQKQYQQVDELIDALKASFGESVSLSDLNTIKRGQWAQVKFDATRPSYAPDVHYELGRQAKNIIEDRVPEADIKKLNNYLGDHFDAIKNLEKIDGSKVKGGRLGGYFARTTGAIIGAKGGPLGSVVGAYGGDVIHNIMQNYYLAGPIKRMLLQRIESNSPVYEAAQEALRSLQKENFSRVMNTKALPPPSTIFSKAPANRINPKPIITEAQRATARNPKTGKIFRYYKSTSK